MKSLAAFRLIFVLAGLLFGTVAVHAQDSAVKSRIEQRLSAINALKSRGVAGENNKGFLDGRGTPTPADQRLMAEENADRQSVYTAIAAKTGSNSEAVGRKRAEQIASLARPGVWIQDASGAWRQK